MLISTSLVQYRQVITRIDISCTSGDRDMPILNSLHRKGGLGSLWHVSYVTGQEAVFGYSSCNSGGMLIELFFRYPIQGSARSEQRIRRFQTTEDVGFGFRNLLLWM
ncbi:hypothetical protein J6590_058908, partial [Homalodisca vitripennis]